MTLRDFHDPGRHDIQRAIRGTLREESVAWLEQAYHDLSSELLELCRLEAFEQDELAQDLKRGDVCACEADTKCVR